MAHDVFISYAREDKTTADATVHFLERAGLRCWIAPRDATPGAQFGASVIDAINSCRLVVLILSSHSNRSDWVIAEVERAASKHKAILPVRVEDVQPSGAIELYIAGRHWLDAIDPPMERHLDELCAKIRALVDAAREDGSGADAATPSTRSVSRGASPPRARLLVGGLAASLAIAGAAWWMRARPQGEAQAAAPSAADTAGANAPPVAVVSSPKALTARRDMLMSELANIDTELARGELDAAARDALAGRKRMLEPELVDAKDTSALDRIAAKIVQLQRDVIAERDRIAREDAARVVAKARESVDVATKPVAKPEPAPEPSVAPERPVSAGAGANDAPPPAAKPPVTREPTPLELAVDSWRDRRLPLIVRSLDMGNRVITRADLEFRKRSGERVEVVAHWPGEDMRAVTVELSDERVRIPSVRALFNDRSIYPGAAVELKPLPAPPPSLHGLDERDAFYGMKSSELEVYLAVPAPGSCWVSTLMTEQLGADWPRAELSNAMRVAGRSIGDPFTCQPLVISLTGFPSDRAHRLSGALCVPDGDRLSESGWKLQTRVRMSLENDSADRVIEHPLAGKGELCSFDVPLAAGALQVEVWIDASGRGGRMSWSGLRIDPE